MSKRRQEITYRVVNADGDTVCNRGTLAACLKLLDKYATEPPTYPAWSNGPYRIFKLTTQYVKTHRPKAVQS